MDGSVFEKMSSIDLSGQWKIFLKTEDGVQRGSIILPGILQGQGYGNPITCDTPWVSGLHDVFWYEQEEYRQGQGNEVLVSFLSQPPRHFLGKAYYEREFEVDKAEEEWFFRVELARWRSTVWIDGVFKGEDCSLCTAHEISCGSLSAGKHIIRVCIDNSMQYPYRPDGHGVGDALGATWNGMLGELVLETASVLADRKRKCLEYAKEHPRRAEVKDGKFYINGRVEYFRGTHFGGEYPLTGHPVTQKEWWLEKIRIIKEWGLNAIRFHSYCPPEAAFRAADEAEVYLLVECGMWNYFKEGLPMLSVLQSETKRILEQFGHHPSFTFFSPSNEPGGSWYRPLQDWVQETAAYDRVLGYEGRRLYTAQSGWFYDVPPKDITGTDFVYLHRTDYGSIPGGNIRSFYGWRGGNYSASLEGVRQPVICHELGQWCAYPDFDIIHKFTGYMKPGNYMVFKELARKRGLLPINRRLSRCSGQNQLRLYKEELEANFRTRELMGFELLDLHDYLGQGTAPVGLLDAFWENKGYATAESFRSFCGETVLLAACPSYVYKNTDRVEIPVEVCHFGSENLPTGVLSWSLSRMKMTGREQENYLEGRIFCPEIPCGGNTVLGNIELDFSFVQENTRLLFTLTMGALTNQWEIYVYVQQEGKAERRQTVVAFYTHSWQEALAALNKGERVVYAPWLSDLAFECPALSIRNVFWNSQMGPSWGRSMGIVVEKEHPLFRDFPTEESGGWQWEDILEHARGFDLRGMEELSPIVRPIDDWNRSLPLGLILEGKVGDGSLLLVTADLEGDFEQRPAAHSLKQAILQYAASPEFEPQHTLKPEWIAQRLFPLRRMEELVEECTFDEAAKVTGWKELFMANPNHSLEVKKETFPITITITLKKPMEAAGWLYLPAQRERVHEGFLKDYVLEYLDGDSHWREISRGQFLNTTLSQKVELERKITAQSWRFIICSCYGCVDRMVWKRMGEGWFRVFTPGTAVLRLAGLHLICGEQKESGAASMDIFWEAEPKFTKKKEIEN